MFFKKEYYFQICELYLFRGVAQPGSAPGLGPGGRKFESCRPDQLTIYIFFYKITLESL